MKNNMERQFYSINLVVELDASDNITMKDIKGLTLDDTYAVDIKAIDPEDENLKWLKDLYEQRQQKSIDKAKLWVK
tara:strand:- start:297 stop:524 length:228 start_codon:yes stop_codon:yes gene_type:complete